MNGVSTDKAPSASVVVPHFVAAGIGFLILSVLILLSVEDFFGHFYQPRLLAITHVAALGWVTMIIFGALYQLIPVVFETSLFSEKLAKINLWIFVAGVSGMVYAFWVGSFGNLLPWFSSLTALALILFSINVLLSVKGAAQQNYSSKFITTAVFWLLSTAILGLLLALNHTFGFLNTSNFAFLKIHAHFGIAGWFLQLIMGISSVLIPMFLVSHDLDEKKLKLSYWLVNAGLLLLTLGWFLNDYENLRPLFVGLIIVGILFFIAYLRDAYIKKLRKLDIGMQLTGIAFAGMILPIVLGVFLSFQHFIGKGIPSNVTTLYGFTIFFAFITPLILGQTYKTLPFIVWLSHYQLFIGKKKTPMPADLYSNRIAKAHTWSYVAAILILSIGIFTTTVFLAQIGAGLLVLTAVLYITNVIKIMSHKTTTAPLFAPKPKLNTHDNLMELLKTVIDPEVEISIVDMGLIYKLDYDDDKKVDIEMTLSTPNCPIADSIVMNVMEVILTKYPDFDTNVHLTFEPRWTPDLITDEGRRMLKDEHKWK